MASPACCLNKLFSSASFSTVPVICCMRSSSPAHHSTRCICVSKLRADPAARGLWTSYERPAMSYSCQAVRHVQQLLSTSRSTFTVLTFCHKPGLKTCVHVCLGPRQGSPVLSSLSADIFAFKDWISSTASGKQQRQLIKAVHSNTGCSALIQRILFRWRMSILVSK